MADRGCFITLEGGEGAGKSTLANGLAEHLRNAGHTVLCTREPGGVPQAEAIRTLLLNPDHAGGWRPLSEALLFNAARFEHLETLIRPALARGEHVICDRFADSTRVYQLAGDAAIDRELLALERMVVSDTGPDLTLVLDLPVELGRLRLAGRGAAEDSFEQRDDAFHERVRQGFLRIAEDAPDRCKVLDATKDAEQVLALAVDVVDARMKAMSS